MNAPVLVVGGGPAGLMAAETIASAGLRVVVIERMPSVGRKLLMAGRGGLNLTHGEGIEALLARYGGRRGALEAAVRAFPPEAVVAWCEGLGQRTFVGSSGRVFPVAMKASPLLRAWLGRLSALGVTVRTRTQWAGWNADGTPVLEGGESVPAAAVVLGLGGASWPRLGSDGAWTGLMGDVRVAALRPANCGFEVAWSEVLRSRFAGQPLKRVALTYGDRVARGEAMLTGRGIEGGVIYAASAWLREAIAASGPVTVHLDLRPDVEEAALARALDARGSRSLPGALRSAAGLAPAAAALVQEALHAGASGEVSALIKACPVRLLAPMGLERAISTAGGVGMEEVDPQFMLRRRPGVFVAGEMLDWEGPTGGYLLQGCLSTGVAAGRGAVRWCGAV